MRGNLFFIIIFEKGVTKIKKKGRDSRKKKSKNGKR